MEKVPTDDDDRPRQEIKITGATVFVNPYKEEEEAERKAAEEARLKVLPTQYATRYFPGTSNILDLSDCAYIHAGPCSGLLCWKSSSVIY